MRLPHLSHSRVEKRNLLQQANESELGNLGSGRPEPELPAHFRKFVSRSFRLDFRS